jgi:predicted small secreted protein
MKNIQYIASILLLCSYFGMVGCANTAKGMHEDWREGTQKIANSTND